MNMFEQEEGFPLDIRKSLYEMLEGSIGTGMFRRLYGQHGDTAEDVIRDGDLACAYFVSSILTHFKLIKGGFYTTVRLTVEDMMVDSDWQQVEFPEPLAVVMWAEKQGNDGHSHFHLGICVDSNQAIEHSAVTKCPRRIGIKGLTMPDGSPRPPVAYFVHPKLRT